LENWFELEFVLLKVLKLQPSELDRMEYYRVEYLMENLEKYNEKENQHRKKEEEAQKSEYGDMSPSGMMNMSNNMMKNAQTSMPSYNMPSMPNMGSFKF
jgi:hypothetical protein